MAENSKISWTDHTFNPWIGCQKVSPACDNCYAEIYGKRFGVQCGAHAERKRTSATNWKLPFRWNRKAKKEGKRYRVFCGSLCDVFDNAVSLSWKIDLFHLMRSTKNLDWLILTKRIGKAHNLWRALSGPDWEGDEPFPSNIWLGITVCNQAEADRDIPKLLEIPVSKRFLSIEPMLGAINLEFTKGAVHGCDAADYRLDFVIVGGESGPKARPMHPDWVRSIRDQCREAGVPFHFKQWGGWIPNGSTVWCREGTGYPYLGEGRAILRDGRVCLSDPPRSKFHGYPPFVVDKDAYDFLKKAIRSECDITNELGYQWMYRVGRKESGHMLDGREHLEIL